MGNTIAFRHVKAPVVIVPALLLLALALPAFSQSSCLNDGVQVEFNEKGGVVQLNDVRVREIIGSNRDDQAIGLGSGGTQSVQSSAGRLRVNGLSGVFPDSGISAASIIRNEHKLWTANFGRGDYEFDNKGDLELEIQVTVIGGQAMHVSGGQSNVTLSAADTDIRVRWYGGGRNQLKAVSGDLNFSMTDLTQLGLFGTHRAEVNVCINIRGNV